MFNIKDWVRPSEILIFVLCLEALHVNRVPKISEGILFPYSLRNKRVIRFNMVCLDHGKVTSISGVIISPSTKGHWNHTE